MVNGPNLYAYCSNNPTNLIDPWGLQGNGGNFPGGNSNPNKCPKNQTPTNPDESQGIPPNIILDIIALGGDLVSLIPTPYTVIGGYAVGAIASISGTTYTCSQFVSGSATRYDVAVSFVTTTVGFIPGSIGIAAAGVQLVYDLIRLKIGP
jgi:hypothetical protein